MPPRVAKIGGRSDDGGERGDMRCDLAAAIQPRIPQKQCHAVAHESHHWCSQCDQSRLNMSPSAHNCSTENIPHVDEGGAFGHDVPRAAGGAMAFKATVILGVANSARETICTSLHVRPVTNGKTCHIRPENSAHSILLLMRCAHKTRYPTNAVRASQTRLRTPKPAHALNSFWSGRTLFEIPDAVNATVSTNCNRRGRPAFRTAART